MQIKKNIKKSVIFSFAIALVFPSSFYAENIVGANKIVINEIESNDPNKGSDWIELYNKSDTPIDISGWVVVDSKGLENLDTQDTHPFEEGSIIEPKGYFTIDTGSMGLGKNETITLYNKDRVKIDEVSYTGHAKDTFGRIPDGEGELVETISTKREKNRASDIEVKDKNKLIPSEKSLFVRINEIESNGSDRDWVEIFNNSDEVIDISGWHISDFDITDMDHYSIKLPEGTLLNPKSYFVFEADIQNDIKHFNFGLGASDAVFLYDKEGAIVDKHEWKVHAKSGLSRIPNGTGEFKDVILTKGAENRNHEFQEENKQPSLDLNLFPGKETYEYIDINPMFLEDSSGLDVYNNELWAVDNGTATIWKMIIDDNGIPSFAKGFEKGKKVVFIEDQNELKPASPDAEGITVDSSGNVYLAVERDNGNKAINKSMILQVVPSIDAERLIPTIEWDLTEVIDKARQQRGIENYKVQNNYGIETVEWISNSKLEGKFIDQNTNLPYQSSNYNSVSNGLFFTGLEEDGYIYVFALEENGDKILISQIDSGLGMVMGLDYDEETEELWLLSDNGRDNTLAKITLNSTLNPTISYYSPPTLFDLKENNEGFAIGKMMVNGYRPVYWFMDGVKKNALKLGWMNYSPEIKEERKEGILTFDLGGGTLNGSTDPLIIRGKVGDEILIPQPPTKQGYEFLYWKGSKYHPNEKYVIIGNHKFTAEWSKIESNVSVKSYNPPTGDYDVTYYMLYMIISLIGLIYIKNNKIS